MTSLCSYLRSDVGDVRRQVVTLELDCLPESVIKSAPERISRRDLETDAI